MIEIKLVYETCVSFIQQRSLMWAQVCTQAVGRLAHPFIHCPLIYSANSDHTLEALS